jgi:hypothetical protein
MTLTGDVTPSQTPTVQTVSGEEMTVQTAAEERWYSNTKQSYLEQLRFTETTDLRDLDRVLLMELLIFRWGQHLAAGADYQGFEVDEDKMRMQLRQFSEQLNKTKESMGLAKRARDAATAEGNFAVMVSDLKMRAAKFGMHRQKQLQEALVLMNELSAIVGAYDRADTEEREKIGFENEAEIMKWIRATMLPEYKALDEHFRTHEQSLWTTTVTM